MRGRRAAEVVLFAPLGALATLAARLAGRRADEPFDDMAPGIGGLERRGSDGGDLPADAPVPAAAELAIEGYDHLAASQVIDRLATLTPAELSDVAAYEHSHKRRQVVLGRLAQLLP